MSGAAQHVEIPLANLTLGDLRDLLEAVDHLPDSHRVYHDVECDDALHANWVTA